MPTQKKFLDEAGLIQLLQEIESLDETNLKDVYWSTDNADVNPTIIFKQGDDNGAAHSIHKVTFAGDTSNDTETALTGTKYGVHYITITIGGVSKTIPYLVTTRLPSTAVTHSHQNDTGDPTAANTVKVALDRIVTKLNSLKSTNITMNAAISGLNITTSDTVQSAFEKVNTAIANIDPADEKVRQTSITGRNGVASVTSPVNMLFGNAANGQTGEAYTGEAQYYPEIRAIKLIQNYDNTSLPIWLANGGLAFGGVSTPSTTNYINKDNYTGKALKTEADLKDYYLDPDVAGSGGNSGAAHIGYTDIQENFQSDNVAGVLQEISSLIYDGDNQNDGLIVRVTALETNKADKSAAVGNITGTTGGNETANYTMVNGTAKTFVYKNDKVTQTADTQTTSELPILLANSASGGTAATKYRGNVTVKPSDGTLHISNPSSDVAKNVVISSDTITFDSGAQGSTPVTLTSTQYGGNAATSTNATNDGSGNNIVNTYATKAALEALTNQLTGSFQIVTTLPTADGTHGGIIYLIKDQEYGDTNSNIFKEYIEVNDSTTSTPNWKFELLGTTDAGVDVVTIPATGSNSVHSYFAQYVLNA